MDTQDLEQQLKKLIIDTCNIPDAPEDFSSNAPLIGPESPLELDSLDAVEVVVAVQKAYGVRIGGEDSSREVLQSVKTLAEYIAKS
ncbi:MAG: phosphopantetheine-binding protein [Desulfuromonadaceae bacterium]|nr:phosphopantetheine-binding protein [Desulfuromonadaceae bacterium]